jgi:hypothetical protein
MAPTSIYEVRFRALAPEDLGDDPAGRLRAALASMPGIKKGAIGADHDPPPRTVSGTFTVEVNRGMAVAARDSSRLAKEALKLAGMGDARLVELRIALQMAG